MLNLEAEVKKLTLIEKIPDQVFPLNASCKDEKDILHEPGHTLLKDEDEKICPYNTGVIYDKRMSDYWCVSESNHPERPSRISSILDKLHKENLTDRCIFLTPRMATKEEVLLKHSEKHYETILSVKNMTSDEMIDLERKYDSIYFHSGVSDASMLSVGCTLEVVEQVLKGNILNGVGIVRPPGHHALTHCSMGFCHFNNVALAAMMAINKYCLKRILIVDWDVHYGNGIHKMFEDDPRVLYMSLHRYDHQAFWPCLSEGNYDAVGTGDGEGFNVHVAWNEHGIRDADYLCAFQNVLMPIAKEYNPEVVLVSSGFDSGKGDPLGECNVTPNGYAHMTKYLMDLANGKVIIILEGGYNLKTISNSMAACVWTLLGKVPEHISKNKPTKSVVNSITNTYRMLEKYWNSLKNIDINAISSGTEELGSPTTKCDQDVGDFTQSVDFIK